jgi:homoserine kinase
VRVPATSANLGPGFDSLALALDLYDDVSVELTEGALRFDVSGEGAGEVARDESHLVVRALRQALQELGGRAGGLTLRSTNRIPHGRGLGSSAAAICAGVLLARELVDGDRVRDGQTGRSVDDGGLLALASSIEGHPDNVAACLLGGATLARTWQRTARRRYPSLSIGESARWWSFRRSRHPPTRRASCSRPPFRTRTQLRTPPGARCWWRP